MANDDSNEDAHSVTECPRQVAAVLLAAGGSTRMGRPKALLPWGDAPLVRHLVSVAAASRCAGVWVVVGDQGEATELALGGLDHELVANPSWREGVGTSLRAGIAALPDEIDAALLMLCDQPFVSPPLLDSLIDMFIEGRNLAACTYDATVGPPALFDRSHFPALARSAGDRGAKSLLLDAGRDCGLVDFPEGAFDLDTPDDYDRALAAR
ncbi:MAG: nucleotidyltransferase family protein [Myxococcota bacterium]|jgi:molybdenum cofactor cytidylyltransferase|nr:nucleotidyltransferase family protein [Myxococcota bacterium]